jgi:hypothetical protein
MFESKLLRAVMVFSYPLLAARAGEHPRRRLPAIRRRLAASLSVPWRRRSQLARRAYVYFEDEPPGTKLLTRMGSRRMVANIATLPQSAGSHSYVIQGPHPNR